MPNLAVNVRPLYPLTITVGWGARMLALQAVPAPIRVLDALVITSESAAAAVAVHEARVDDVHSQYVLKSGLAALVAAAGFMLTSDASAAFDPLGAASAALANSYSYTDDSFVNHLAAADPHGQYALESSLNTLATALLTGTANSTTFLRGDNAYASELTGNFGLNRAGGAASATLFLSVDNANPAILSLRTGGLPRWQLYKDGTSETGANAGSSFGVIGYDDAGNSLGTYMYMGRASAVVGFKGNGSFGGISGQAQVKLALQGNSTGATTTYGARVTEAIQPDVTAQYNAFQAANSTAVSAFTLPTYNGFSVLPPTIGAGSAITAANGFNVASTFTTAANNYGYRGQLPSGAANWNLYFDGTAPSYMAAGLRLGTTSANSAMLVVAGSANATGATTRVGAYFGETPQSDVTSRYSAIQIQPANAAAAYTLGSLDGINISAYTSGAGSTVTAYSGIRIFDANGPTGVYGINLAITAGTGKYNIYAAGSAQNYFAGAVGIGQAPATGYNLYLTKGITGAVTSVGMGTVATVQSDVTAAANTFFTNIGTVAAAFTLPDLRHYLATQATFGAGSTVTRQVGFAAAASLTGASFNYGFQGNLVANGSANWNLYMQGTAPNYLAGPLLIGSTGGVSGNALRIAGANITGATTAYGITVDSTVQSDVTATAAVFRSNVGTLAASFTLSNLRHFYVNPAAFGAGSTVTAQVGYMAESSLTGAGTNYGFQGALPANGTANWNLYMSGGAPNYMAGSLGIGGTNLTGFNFRMTKTVTGSTSSRAASIEGVIQSDVTTEAVGVSSGLGTAATSFTLPDLYQYRASQGLFGVGSTVTRQYGFAVLPAMSGAATNYAFYNGLAASGTANWAMYSSGTAPSYFAGQVTIGSNSLDASAAFAVTSTTQGLLPPRMTTTQRDAIASPTAGLLIYNTTTGKLNVRGASAWEAVTSA